MDIKYYFCRLLDYINSLVLRIYTPIKIKLHKKLL